MKTKVYESLGEMIRDPEVIWYGPHPCALCGETVVRSAKDSGGVALDAPHEHHYPNHQWRLHQCKAAGCNSKSSSAAAAHLVDFSPGKVIRIKYQTLPGHCVWRVTGVMPGACKQESLIALRRLDNDPGSNVDGKIQQDSLVPYILLLTNPFIENV